MDILLVLIFAAAFYFIITRILPLILAWYIERRFNVEVKIGSISIPYFRLKQVLVCKNGVSIHFDEIGFRSSFLTSDVNKIICLEIHEVRINKDISEPQFYDSLDPEPDPFRIRDFTNQKIPPLVITFAQFMAVHIHTITAHLLRTDSPEWLLHAGASDVTLDGSLVRSARILLVNISVQAATVKLVRHAPPPSPRPHPPSPSPLPATLLAQVSLCLSAEATLQAQGPFSIEKLFLGLDHTKAIIHESFYSFAASKSKGQRYHRRRRAPQDRRHLNEEDVYNLMKYTAPIIPKNIVVNVQDAVITGMKANIHTELNATLQKLHIESRLIPPDKLTKIHPWPSLMVSLGLEGLDVKGERRDILSLAQFTLDSRLEDFVLAVNLTVQELRVTYDHRSIHVWYESNLCHPTVASPQLEDATSGLLASHTSLLGSSLWRQFSLEACAQLWNVSALCRLSKEGPRSVIGFNKTKLSLSCDPENDFEEISPIAECLPRDLRHRTLHSELLVESVYCSLNVNNVRGATFLKKCHSWGTALYIGVILIKLKIPRVPNTPKLNAMFDTLRFEWSADLCLFLLDVLKCTHQYKESSYKCRKMSPPTLNFQPQHSKPRQRLFVGTLVSSVHLTNVNLFYISDQTVCVMSRVDSLSLESGLTKALLEVEGVKLVSIVPSKHQFVCVRCEEVKDAVGSVKQVRVEYKYAGSITVDLYDHLIICWSMNLHLKLLTMHQEIIALVSSLCGARDERPELTSSSSSSSTSSTAHSLAVNVKGQCALRVIVSPEHSVLFETDSITYSRSLEQETAWDLPVFYIKVDDVTMFTLESVNVMTMQRCESITVEREHIEDFEQQTNRAWCWNIKSFKAIFPYEHDFATAYQNEFISVVKWLRLLHKKPQTGVRPLPCDFILKVKEFLFEASDDPFEVKLRDNYELLEDEYKESLKRQKMLDSKLEDLYKSNLLIPSAKLEELYANLNAMNSKIYIHRCRQMSAQVTPRTRLFAAVMNEVEIIAMADPCIHGAENVVNVMTEIDQDSPWPEDGVEFSTLWCRAVIFSCREWKFLLRDFPLPWLDIGQMHLWGRLVGAEQEATRRAKRGVRLQIGDPFGDITVERSMTSLKFYHDFNCEVEHLTYAFGPCWEPVIAQCNLGLEKIFPPSRDPSPPLPLWDKIRLLYHGRLTMIIRQLTLLLHVSLDPYNTTEEMEVTWSNVAMDWTTGKFVYKGDLDVYVRTASKYDDCRLLHFPNLKLSIKLSWLCLGEPHDHHSVMPCAPDKLPEYSSNQEHDSYRAFRSHNVNVSLGLETKPLNYPVSPSDPDSPVILLYGSTLRWFENLKFILSGVTRPTRRGAAFKNFKPRKIPLSRHYRKLHFLLSLHKFQAHYWMSFAMQRGIELISQRITSSSEHTLSLVPVEDGLKHRPRPNWTASYMNCELNDAEVWLKSLAPQEEKEVLPLRQPVEKCYCLSVGKVSYGRETTLPSGAGVPPALPSSGGASESEAPPTHRLVVHHLKGAWTPSNRDVVFALFESFVKTQQLKKNLSTAALKSFRASDASSTPMKSRSRSVEGQITPPSSSALQSQVQVQNTPSPMSKLQSGQAASMLQQLIAEVENKAVVFSDDLSAQTREQHLQGLQACHEDDVIHKNWLIALVNSQVLLKGCETKGYVIVSAAKAEILQRVHRPVWKDRILVSKTTWIGSLECMQYYATVLAGQNDSLDENIMWLSVENIQETQSAPKVSDVPDIPHLVGSGCSVGGVVSETVGASQAENPPLQLQRIVSRCKCEFFYATQDEASISPGLLAEAPRLPSPETLTPWDERDRGAADVFTLMHHDLDVCTNSLQYAMILDILNNLLLYVEPKRKEAYEKLQRMRFQLQLHSVEDQRRPIQQLQNRVRCLVAKLRRLERETYLIQRAPEELCDEELLREMKELEAQVFECKEQLMSESEELGMMISCYKETQLTAANSKLTNMRNDKPITSVRASEIVFKHAQWRLTQQDGQLGIADLVLSNFLYTKNCKSDDSVEHLLELGYIRMTNLLPNQTYKEVIVPTEIQSNMPIDRKRAIRIFCREKAPVGGISVKEHFEINVVPLTIGLTRKFYQTMLKFCFPERDPENIEDTERSVGTGGGKKGSTSKESNFYVVIDDVDKMKERAEKNKLFIYIKIPEVPIKLSYKGNKEKNLSDVRDFSLIIPTLEYHNVTWTWLDLLLAMKNDSRRVILSQAIKQKLTINRYSSSSTAETTKAPAEAQDKAKMLFGPVAAPGSASQRFFKK